MSDEHSKPAQPKEAQSSSSEKEAKRVSEDTRRSVSPSSPTKPASSRSKTDRSTLLNRLSTIKPPQKAQPQAKPTAKTADKDKEAAAAQQGAEKPSQQPTPVAATSMPKAPAAPAKPRGTTDKLSSDRPPAATAEASEDKRVETNLVTRENVLKAMQSEFVYGDETIKSQAGTLLVIVQGAMERYYTKDGLSLTLGRKSDAGKVDIDLTPFGGHQRGVSRLHARLHIEKNELYITDLNSSNGTFLDGQRLRPYQPYQVTRRYSLLVLGSLSVQLSYRKP